VASQNTVYESQLLQMPLVTSTHFRPNAVNSARTAVFRSRNQLLRGAAAAVGHRDALGRPSAIHKGIYLPRMLRYHPNVRDQFVKSVRMMIEQNGFYGS